VLGAGRHRLSGTADYRCSGELSRRARADEQLSAEPIRELATKAQVIVPKQRAIYDALQRYAADNNGKYPQSLKQLAPKYVAEDPTQPIQLDDGTEVRLIYKPPKPDAAPETVILEHKPPINSHYGTFRAKSRHAVHLSGATQRRGVPAAGDY
jgi:hypothetical protein